MLQFNLKLPRDATEEFSYRIVSEDAETQALQLVQSARGPDLSLLGGCLQPGTGSGCRDM